MEENIGSVMVCVDLSHTWQRKFICEQVRSLRNSVLIAEYDGFPLDVWGCGVVYITLVFGGLMWQKAAEGDVGYDRFIASIRASEARAARKEAKLAAEEAREGEAKDDANDA